MNPDDFGSDYVVDFLGQRVEVGDKVVYPIRQGSGMDMKLGVVREIRLTKKLGGSYVEVAVSWIMDHSLRTANIDGAPTKRYAWVGRYRIVKVPNELPNY